MNSFDEFRARRFPEPEKKLPGKETEPSELIYFKATTSLARELR
jgi:hypothetical protein